MIINFKGVEYCLTDWRSSFHTDMWFRYLIEQPSGKVSKISFIGLICGRVSWSLAASGKFEIIYDIHKEIYPDYSVDYDNLKQGQQDIDRFLTRVDKIKSFI